MIPLQFVATEVVTDEGDTFCGLVTVGLKEKKYDLKIVCSIKF